MATTMQWVSAKVTIEAEQALRKARRKIQRGWARKTYARDANGHEALLRSPKATNFCARGAIYSSVVSVDARCAAFEALAHAIGTRTIAAWNDRQKSKRPVLAAFDKAIAQLKAQRSQGTK